MYAQSQRARATTSEKGAAAQQAPSPETDGANQTIEPKKSGGLLGWFQDAGDYVAGKYHQAKDAVGSAIDTTMRVAGDVVDVVRTTGVSYSDGKIGLDTDLDEVLDLMPASVREQVRLGAGAENRVNLRYDVHTNTLEATSKDLDIQAANLGSVQTGAARLQDVRVTVKDPRAALAMVQGGPAADAGVDLAVGQGRVKDVVLPGAQLAELSVQGLRGQAAKEKGEVSGSFSADAVGATGLRQGDRALGGLALERVAGGTSGREESAWFEAGAARATGLDESGVKIAAADAQDVRVDVRNAGGGLIGLDEQPDHLNATVTASASTVDGVTAAAGGVDRASLDGLRVDADQDTRTLALAARSLGASGARGAGATVGALSGKGLEASLSPDAWSAELDHAALERVDAQGYGARRATAAGLSARGDAGGLTAQVGQLGLDEVSSKDAAIQRAEGKGLAVDTTHGDARIRGESVGVTGARIGEVGVGTAALGDVRATVASGATDVSAATAALTDFDAKGLHAGGLTARGASARLEADAMGGSVDAATVTDLRLQDALSVGSATVTGASGHVAGDERTTAVASAQASDVRYEAAGLDVASLSATDARLRQGAAGTQASLGHLHAEGLGYATPEAVTAPATAPKAGEVVPATSAPAPATVTPEEAAPARDMAALTRTLTARVDDADLAASAPLRAGQYSSGVGLRVDEGTTLDARASIRDNAVADLDARASRPIDAPLWTDLKGLYTKDGALKAEVGGWFDQDITESVNGALGVKDERIASLATYGAAAADAMSRPAPAPAPVTTPAPAAPTAKKAEKPVKPGIHEALDTDRLTAEARVHLSAGALDTGAERVVLGGAARANTVHAQVGGGVVAARSDALAVDAVQAGALSTGAITAEDARLRAEAGKLSGSVGALDVADLTYRKP